MISIENLFYLHFAHQFSFPKFKKKVHLQLNLRKINILLSIFSSSSIWNSWWVQYPGLSIRSKPTATNRNPTETHRILQETIWSGPIHGNQQYPTFGMRENLQLRIFQRSPSIFFKSSDETDQLSNFDNSRFSKISFKTNMKKKHYQKFLIFLFYQFFSEKSLKILSYQSLIMFLFYQFFW
jgi:hypothetical protein